MLIIGSYPSSTHRLNTGGREIDCPSDLNISLQVAMKCHKEVPSATMWLTEQPMNIPSTSSLPERITTAACDRHKKWLY
ncbi:hypothetical protein HanPSC8_Chr16g0710991 [Helianthus annuus]|nr:hypothetical protein HanPSC8_Chr16g0710991 [Helianthus annuus]